MNVLSYRFLASFLSALCILFSAAAFGQTYILQQNFEGSFPPSGWTFYTNPNAASGWLQGPVSPLIDPCIPQGSKTMTSQWATYYANDTWAFTPGQNLTAGITYDISFAQCVKSPSNNKTESMKLTVGTSATYQGQTTTLLNLPTLNNTSPVTRTASFTPQVSGTYYFAFHCYSAANQRYLSVDDVKISFTVSCTTTYMPVSASICPGSTYNFYGNMLSSPGNYNHILSDINGCDSIIQLTLSVHPVATTPVSASICAGNAYNFYGNMLSSPGNYNHILSDINGCDSIIQLTLSVHSISTTPVSAAICAGNTYDFYGNMLTSPGNYNHILFDINGCDSIIQLALSVNPVATTPVSAAICAGNTYDFYGNMLSSPGNYNHILSDINGCDSIIQLTLSLHSISTTNIIAAICPGDTYSFHGYLLTVPGTYYDTLLNVQGCDSVIVLNLTVYSLLDITVTQSGSSLQANEADAAYQWIECSNQNSIFPGATAQSYTALHNGDYAVVLDKNGCIDTSACYTVNTLSTSQETFQDLILYPNPAREVIYITAKSNIEQVSMMDITGKQVLLKENIKLQHIQLDVGNFPEGMYFLEIIYEKGKTIKQVIKS